MYYHWFGNTIYVYIHTHTKIYTNINTRFFNKSDIYDHNYRNRTTQ